MKSQSLSTRPSPRDRLPNSQSCSGCSTSTMRAIIPRGIASHPVTSAAAMGSRIPELRRKYRSAEVQHELERAARRGPESPAADRADQALAERVAGVVVGELDVADDAVDADRERDRDPLDVADQDGVGAALGAH